MAQIVNPAILFRLCDFQKPAPIIGLDRLLFFVISKAFIIVYDDFDIAAGNSSLQKYFDKRIDRTAGIEDIVDEHDFIAGAKIFGRIRPSVDVHFFVLLNVGIRSCDNGRVQNGMIILPYEFVILADNVRHICTSAQRTINHIRYKSVGVHFMRNFKSIVSNDIERKKFLYHRDNLILVL